VIHTRITVLIMLISIGIANTVLMRKTGWFIILLFPQLAVVILNLLQILVILLMRLAKERLHFRVKTVMTRVLAKNILIQLHSFFKVFQGPENFSGATQH